MAGANSILRRASRPGIGGIKDVSSKNMVDPISTHTKKREEYIKKLPTSR